MQQCGRLLAGARHLRGSSKGKTIMPTARERQREGKRENGQRKKERKRREGEKEKE